MQESYKAMRRRSHQLKYIKYFSGSGLDVGCGSDKIIKFRDSMPKMRHVKCWDIGDGDGQYLKTIPDLSLDFVHSSHSLEHMKNWDIALDNWFRVLKPGGFIICCVPDWELYEHKLWPSRFNSDHKWAFTLGEDRANHIINLKLEFLEARFNCKVIELSRIEDGFDWNKKYIDQTGPADGPECAIEFVLRKK